MALLMKSGVGAPRVAVAALNPHAGEGGLLGTEEDHDDCAGSGPPPQGWPGCDRAVAGRYAVHCSHTRGLRRRVTMYHDQGQIALKLLGFDRVSRVAGGLPVAITTPAHGTAFNIAGKGVADVGAMREAFGGSPAVWLVPRLALQAHNAVVTRCGVLLFSAALICGAQDQFAAQREGMVREQIASRGIKNAEVLKAMRAVPRHSLSPPDVRSYAYEDRPVPIGYGRRFRSPTSSRLCLRFRGAAGPPGAGDRYRVGLPGCDSLCPDSGKCIRSRLFPNWRNRPLRRLKTTRVQERNGSGRGRVQGVAGKSSF